MDDTSDYARFLIQTLEPDRDLTVIDIGCGYGGSTVELARAIPAGRIIGVDTDAARIADAQLSGVQNATFRVASAYELPVPENSVEVVFAHAVLEHLAEPKLALAEAMRVLRPGGTLAVSTSDWSRAKIRPKTANVDAAQRGYFMLLQRAGGDPFAGRSMADQVQQCGFTAIRTKVVHRPDLGYTELARRIEADLAAALEQPDGGAQLASAARSAAAWADSGRGEVQQCWVELLATAPG